VTAAELAAAAPGAARQARRFVVPALIAAGVVLADQASKAAVTDWLGPDAPRRSWEPAGEFFAFEYVENTGAAFGSFPGQSDLLIVVALAVIAGLVVYYRRVPGPSRLLGLCLGLLVGGALGNLIDRWRLGHVVDFVAVGIWPRFNLADVAVTLGVAILAWHVVVEERASKPNTQTGPCR
jgi:signal peptidase II